MTTYKKGIYCFPPWDIGQFSKNHISMIMIDMLLLTCNAILDLKFHLSFLWLHFFEISTICYSLSIQGLSRFCANPQVLPYYNTAKEDSLYRYFKDWQQSIQIACIDCFHDITLRHLETYQKLDSYMLNELFLPYYAALGSLSCPLCHQLIFFR